MVRLDASALERFFGLSQDLFAVVDFDGVVRYANPAWTQVLGFPPEEVVDRHLSSFLDRGDWTRTDEASRTAIDAGTLHGFENRFRHRDGSIRWIEWNIQVDKDERLAYGVGRDTTSRKATEAALAESEATYRALFDSSIDGILLTDSDGAVRMANPAMRAMIGWPLDMTESLHQDELLDPDDPKVATFLSDRGRTGHSTRELLLKRRDGSRFAAEISAATYIDVSAHERTSMVVRDVSERHRLRSALGAAAERVTLQGAAMEAAANAIVITDRSGTIEWVNSAFTAVTGYSRSEAVGQNPRLLRSGRHPPGFYRDLWDTISAGRVWRGELVNRRKDGSFYPEEQTITPVVDGGSIHHYIAIKQDVSERRRAELALRESEATFRQLFHANPLSMFVCDRDSFAFLAVNETAIQHYGYTEAEFLAMTLRDLPAAEDPAGSDPAPGGAGAPIASAGTWRHVRKDGSLIDVELTGHPLTFGDRRAELVVVQDVTRQLQARDALQRSEERYRMLAENATDVVFRISLHPSLRFEYVSPSVMELIGYTSEEHYADSGLFFTVMHPDDQDLLEITPGDPGQARSIIRMFHKDGHLVHVEQHSRPIHSADGALKGVEGILRDVTDRVQAEQRATTLLARFEKQLDRFKIIHRIDTAILVDSPLVDILSTALNEMTEKLGVDAVAVFRLDPARRRMNLLAGRGMPEHVAAIPFGRGLAGRAARTRAAVTVLDADAPGAKGVQYLRRLGFRGCFAVPLVSAGRLQGAIELFTRAPLHLDDDAHVFTEALSNQIAIAIQRDDLVTDLHNANTELEDAYDRTIEGWAMALDLRDEDTAGHSQHVTSMTLDLAARLGVPETDRPHLRRGALLHDIGKMAVPDAILLKPGRLTPEEFAVVKLHPGNAYDMLKGIHYLRPALAIPHYHHERWDGGGYPEGLSGEAIPLEARIFAVVDVYDALTSDRPYRAAWSPMAALAHIEEGAGAHFDPHVVEAFVDMVSLREL
jgi:PAS domain S-box-containing protein